MSILEDSFLSGDEAVSATNALFVDKVCAPVDLPPGFASLLEICSLLNLSNSVPSLHENSESDESNGTIVSRSKNLRVDGERQQLNVVFDECLNGRIYVSKGSNFVVVYFVTHDARPSQVVANLI